MTFEYTIAAHPTMYKNVLFRSRLEARYAAFFDLLGLKWEYEPIELNGWVPDFRLFIPQADSKSTLKLLAEVKPFAKTWEFYGTPEWNYYAAFFEHRKEIITKLEMHANGVLLLGNTPEVYRMKADVGVGCYSTISCEFEYPGHKHTDCMECRWKEPHDICRGCDPDFWKGFAEPLWKQAGNATQWRKRA